MLLLLDHRLSGAQPAAPTACIDPISSHWGNCNPWQHNHAHLAAFECRTVTCLIASVFAGQPLPPAASEAGRSAGDL